MSTIWLTSLMVLIYRYQHTSLDEETLPGFVWVTTALVIYYLLLYDLEILHVYWLWVRQRADLVYRHVSSSYLNAKGWCHHGYRHDNKSLRLVGTKSTWSNHIALLSATARTRATLIIHLATHMIMKAPNEMSVREYVLPTSSIAFVIAIVVILFATRCACVHWRSTCHCK